MRLFAADLMTTGELRPGLRVAEIADVLWAMNAPEFFLLLAERRWSPQKYESWLAATWSRLLMPEQLARSGRRAG
jgi:hypothetical protein